jgi:lipoprotein-anchoring transpeptidase ErfK/SrfK
MRCFYVASVRAAVVGIAVLASTGIAAAETGIAAPETGIAAPETGIAAAETGIAAAQVVVKIDKTVQQMTVLVGGAERHVWAISSGLDGGPPTGTYKPYRVHRHWFSRKYQWSPMPHSIFFHEGYAIHGTTYVRRLGRPASHGCIRLHPDNAAALFALVKEHGRDNTRIEVEGAIPVVAKAKPHPARKRVFVRRYYYPQPFLFSFFR